VFQLFNGNKVFQDQETSENVSGYSFQSLTDGNGYFRAMLGGKLLNIGTEMSGRINSAVAKQLASNEAIECRLPYGKPFILKQYARLMFLTNVLPTDVENTSAFYRRFLIIPFNISIPEEKQNKNLHKEIIRDELPGIMNLVLDGMDRLIENQNFTKSETVSKAIEGFKSESNTVLLFIEDKQLIASAEDYISLADLFSSYKRFCTDGAYRFSNLSEFKTQLFAKGFTIKRKNIGNVVFAKYRPQK